MITRVNGYLSIREEQAPAASLQLEQQGFAMLPQLLSGDDLRALHQEITSLYETSVADTRNPKLGDEERNDFRYEMLNRSAGAQAAIGHPDILAVIEPLLGEDCHVIANTCWRNPAREENQHGGGYWHIDAGPHVPRAKGVPWPDDIPYPVFAIGAHIYLEDCPLASGPTGVIPGSHRSGQHPPFSQDVNLTCDGESVQPLPAKAGDVVLFVSDVWHRRLPCEVGDSGRFFLQAHYGRRDIAQRLRPTSQANQLSEGAIERAVDRRQRTLIGLHPLGFYDG
ncbi:MAG: phytanoyl-CoA dioxygenase family protein [Pseudomonadaceae bacterium]|nr:phytanoyl-CoA dioxygenase family protein [Pseudomonadaceae bacterium]